MTLIQSSYGKSRVQVMRVARRPDGGHGASELDVSVALRGRFDDAYTRADNAAVVATDTMRNLIYAVARAHAAAPMERFLAALSECFLQLYPQVDQVSVRAGQSGWARLVVDGAPHPHAFTPFGNGQPHAEVTATRTGTRLRSGIDGVTMLKTTGSGFAGFVRDAFTTLPETTDRLFATSLNATWDWRVTPPDYEAARDSAVAGMLRVFAATHSHSVQDSLYRMGQAALDAVAEMDTITLAAPNKHYLPAPELGGVAPTEAAETKAAYDADGGMVLAPTTMPYGQIECTVGRG